MRIEFPCSARFDLLSLHSALLASSIQGISGVSVDESNVYVEAPFRDKITEAEYKAIKQLVDIHVLTPSWDEVRRKRISFLLEVDWRIQRAEDTGARQEELRAYRQALRDITKQSDPNNVVWPPKPW